MLGPDSRIPKEAEEEPNDRKMAATRFCRERDRKSSTSSFLKTRRGAAFCACAALFVIFTVIPVYSESVSESSISTYQQRTRHSSATTDRRGRPRDRLRQQQQQQQQQTLRTSRQRGRTKNNQDISKIEQQQVTDWGGLDFKPPPGAVLVDSRQISSELPNGTYSSSSRSYAGPIGPQTDYRATVNRTVSSSSSSSSSPNNFAQEFFQWPAGGRNSTTYSRTYQKKIISSSSRNENFPKLHGGTTYAYINLTDVGGSSRNQQENRFEDKTYDFEDIDSMGSSFNWRDRTIDYEPGVTTIEDFWYEVLHPGVWNRYWGPGDYKAGRTQGLDTRDNCDSASCYPGVGNLLIGREKRLSATSTCGTRSQERYCVVSHLGERDRCFWCETKPETASNPSLNHHISNIVYKMAPNGRLSWWQSENGKENVSIQVDFEAQFHMTHIIIDFKTVRPAAMIVERSWDFGKTWHAYAYYAHNCASEFPGIPERLPRSLTDVVCDGRYSSATPLSGGQMAVRILPGDVDIKDPYSEDVLNLVKITNLRINFTRLHTLGDDLLDTRSQIKEKYYYALHHVTVRGSCFCYGHASKCVPVEGMPVRTGMVHGRCECTHHTAGLNCEKCEDFFNDVPWRPGIGKKINTCKRCKCNNHATACQFNQTEYDLTSSGGVCINCAHNTEGKHCDTCKQYFYHDPQRDIADMHACLPCDCDPRGSRDDGVCDPKSDPANGMIAGMCHCKRNVDGRRCDRCKMGFWNFEESNPDGCQACTCDPIGIIENQGCNQYSGECQCKANVRGRDCNQCAPEHYGLSANDPLGCKACRCSPGGSYDNECDVVTGQCRCRPHVSGRQCDRPETGYFAGLMDYMLYEAEFAKHSDGGACTSDENCEVVKRERYSDSKETTWTGLGFMRVYEGSYLEFDVPDVRATNEYDLVIRYEPQRAGAWEDVDVKILRSSPIDPNGECRHAYGQSDEYRGVQMPDNARSVLIHPPVCLEAGKNYTIRVSFRSFSRNEPTPTATILVDAIALLPKPESLPFFKGPDGDYLRQEFEQYRCQNAFLTVTKPSLNDVCQKHLYSIGFYTLGQAKGCDCDPTGSLSSRCDPLGGQCECKPNVVGRRCDSCAPGTYGFGPNGCTPCDCDAIGSLDNFCDVRTGECKCRDFKYGRQCDVCQPGRWNFPVCEPCNCNGHADVCDSTTGHCLSCADSTAGPHCETCLEGYYGDPVLGRNIPCRPCPCPETKATGHSFADRCFLSPTTNDVVCDCQFGYTGPRCDRCGDNYFGTPDVRGRECRPCNCSGNTDLTQPGNCDPISGECMRCLYNTEGFNCHECKPGYYGDALRQECIPCNCFFLGTVDQSTVCDRVTGQCPCLPNVIGLDCAKCAPNHWRIASGDGCSACDCDPAGAFSTQCNEFDGQCECRPGFGGRQCDQCLADHWGDPTKDECFPCDCNPIGRNSTQCDKINGKCFCRPGIGGDKCDRCARGFVGSFPNCEPCIECFDNWDTIITDLRAQTEEIVKAAADIKQSGSTGAYPQQFEEMEEKLHKITSLLQNNTLSNEDLELLKVKVEQLKSNLTEISQERNKVDRDIFNTTQRVYLAGIELDRLKDDAEELKAKANALEANATQLQEANVEGALEITKNAERRSNAALEKVRSTDETLKNSARQRKRTEQRLERSSDTMTNKQGDNDQTIERIDRRLTDIEKEIPDINDQVCDKRGDPCDGLCGGGGCNHCGGLSCKEGSVEMSKSALRLAEEAGELLSSRRSANEEQWRKVSQSKVKADEAKSAAEAALQASTNAYNRSAEANEDMKSLMERINEFLNAKGATPAEIRTLAEEVLQKSISLQPQQIQKLAAEINATIQSLTNIDDIIDATAGDLERANSLKERADRAKEQADKVLLVVEAVLEALNAAESAQERAKAAREDADSKVSQAAGLLAQTKTEMSRTQEEANGQTVKVKELKDRLKNVTKDIVDIESDMNSAEREANEANQMANNAVREASMLEKKYGEVKEEFESANKDSQLVRDRARKLQELVMRLDKNITEEVAEVMKMQEEYSRYEERLGQMGDKLRRLEEEMDGYLRVITTKNDHYRNC